MKADETWYLTFDRHDVYVIITLIEDPETQGNL